MKKEDYNKIYEAAADIVLYRDKLRNKILQLYKSREGFYSKVNLPKSEVKARRGILLSQEFDKVSKVLFSYTDNVTKAELEAFIEKDARDITWETPFDRFREKYLENGSENLSGEMWNAMQRGTLLFRNIANYYRYTLGHNDDVAFNTKKTLDEMATDLSGVSLDTAYEKVTESALFEMCFDETLILADKYANIERMTLDDAYSAIDEKSITFLACKDTMEQILNLSNNRLRSLRIRSLFIDNYSWSYISSIVKRRKQKQLASKKVAGPFSASAPFSDKHFQETSHFSLDDVDLKSLVMEQNVSEEEQELISLSCIGVNMFMQQSVYYKALGTELLELIKSVTFTEKDRDTIAKFAILLAQENGFDIKTEVLDGDEHAQAFVMSTAICMFINAAFVKSREKLFERYYMECRKENGKKNSVKTASTEVDIAGKLSKENEELKNKISLIDAEWSQKIKAFKQERNESRDEAAKLRSEKKALSKANSELTAKIEALEELIAADSTEFIDDAGVCSPEEFEQLVKGKRILMWGLRRDAMAKYEELFPDSFIYIVAEKSKGSHLSSQQLQNIDFAVIMTNQCSHSSYYSVRDTIKNAGLPYLHLGKWANNPDLVRDAIAKAIRLYCDWE